MEAREGGGRGDSRGKLDRPLPPQPLQTERQAGAECGLARQVGAEVSAGGAVPAPLPPARVGGSRAACLPRSPRARGRPPGPETGGSVEEAAGRRSRPRRAAPRRPEVRRARRGLPQVRRAGARPAGGISRGDGRRSGPGSRVQCSVVFALQVAKWKRVNRRPRKRKRRGTEETFEKVGVP